jgi:PadR family transcriptional regulator PadR
VRLTAQTLLVLAALLGDPGEWRYGYDLSRETGLKSGCLYPILIRLNERGWLQSKWRHDENQKPRHMYRLTALGQRMGRQTVNSPKALARLKPVAEQGGMA